VKITAVIGRRYEAAQTPGGLFVFDQDQVILDVLTLELPWLDNEREISCIPAGTYKCERLNHPRFGHCWWVKDVPGRSEILFHSGNYASERAIKMISLSSFLHFIKRLFNYHWNGIPMEPLSNPRKVDTEGCIMPGLQFVDINKDGILDIADSQKAMKQLRAVLPDRFNLVIL